MVSYLKIPGFVFRIYSAVDYQRGLYLPVLRFCRLSWF